MSHALKELIPASAGRNRSTEQLPIAEWLKEIDYRVNRSQPHNYDRFPFQEQIVADMSPVQYIMKAAQVAMSEGMVKRVLYVAAHLGKVALYYLPDDNKAAKFSKTRVQARIDNIPYLKARKTGTYEKGLMKVGDGQIFVLGMHSEANVISYAGDYVIRDEIDRSKQDHSEFVKDRIMASDLQWDHALSQPSFPGYGIHKLFNDSDQHHWEIRCESCGTWNCLERDFPQNFMEVPANLKKGFPEGATHYRGCVKCQAHLDMHNGKWVPWRETSQERGYNISQLYTLIKRPNEPNVATQIMKEYRKAQSSKRAIARFTISIIGSPSGGDDAKITDEVLDLAEARYLYEVMGSGMFMGVDVGDILHIAIGMRLPGTRIQPVHFEKTERWARLDELWKRYNLAACVIDAMPYKDSAKKFALGHRDRTWIQYFKPVRGVQVTREPYESTIDIQVVEVDRTESLDKTVEMLIGGTMTLQNRKELSPADKAVIEEVRGHLKMAITEMEEDNHGNNRRVYLRGSQVKNHYLMATNSMRLAALELGINPPAPDVGIVGMWAPGMVGHS